LREIALQSLTAIKFLHSIKLTHTDLKPENILLKCHHSETVSDPELFPIQVKKKREIFGSEKCEDESQDEVARFSPSKDPQPKP